MNKNKRITQSAFSIKKVRRITKSGHVDFTGLTHVWKVTGPNETNKRFATRRHASEWIKKVTDTNIK